MTWREAHRDELLAKKRAYYQANKEKMDAQHRAYVAAHREDRQQYMAQYARDHRDYWNDRAKRWRRENPEKSRRHWANWYALKSSARIMDVTAELLEQKRAYWGGLCWMCGRVADTWDHVKPLSKGGAHAVCNLRPACRSCNSRKRDRWPYEVSA